MIRISGIAALLLGATLSMGMLPAQDYPHYQRESRPFRSDLFEKVQYDLDRAGRNAAPNGRIDHAFHELGEFRNRYNAGQSARHQLDSAIAAVRNLANSDVLRTRDRDILQNDLVSLRRFREDYRARVY